MTRRTEAQHLRDLVIESGIEAERVRVNDQSESLTVDPAASIRVTAYRRGGGWFVQRYRDTFDGLLITAMSPPLAPEEVAPFITRLLGDDA